MRCVLGRAAIFRRRPVPAPESGDVGLFDSALFVAERESVLVAGELGGERKGNGLAPAQGVIESADDGAASLGGRGGEGTAEADKVTEDGTAAGSRLCRDEREEEEEEEMHRLMWGEEPGTWMATI